VLKLFSLICLLSLCSFCRFLIRVDVGFVR